MASINISTLRSIYITNQPYQYPMPFFQQGTGSIDYPGSFMPVINTGWHIIPNILWGHVCSPKQWWEMMIQYEAIRVDSIKCRLFNPIPIQTAVSFQGTGTFAAFNNTVYAFAYKDDIYETPWFNWWDKAYSTPNSKIDLFYEYNPAFKEGLIQKPRTQPYDKATGAADERQQYNEGMNPMKFPKEFPTKIYQSTENSFLEKNTYRRQFLPIYWYNFPFKQYFNPGAPTASWLDLGTNFEYAYNDCSGIFWDPLNRPSELMELRPGKNMIEFSWTVEDCDKNIWFNTDRIASLTPYGRPRPLVVDPGYWNFPLRPRMIDPRGPGNSTNKYEYLKNFGLLKQGEDLTVPAVQMAPEKGMSQVDWRRWPIVPSRWFYKEMQESNPWVYNNVITLSYAKQDSDGDISKGTGCTRGDVQSSVPYTDIKFPGTEYEMHKYPPTQWFIKAVPLYDDKENLIPVEMQMFMYIEISLSGKKRKSALYAPSWGPIEPMDLYSVNMDTNFGENYMRVRSGGARRTYYDPADGPPEMIPNPPTPEGQIYPQDANISGHPINNKIPYSIKNVKVGIPSNKTAPSIPIDSVYCNNQNLPNNIRVTIDNEYCESCEHDFEVLE